MHQSATKRVAVWTRRLAAALGLAVCAVPAAGQQPAPVLPTIPAPGVPVPTAAKPQQPLPEPKPDVAKLTLGECIAIAVEKQPALRAVRSSQDATNTGQRALDNIGRVGALFAPDLAIRKQQSERGVIAAAADVQKLHNEVVQDVTRLYYTVVYARQQEEFSNRVVAKMREFIQIATDLLESTTPGDMTPLKLHLMKLGLGETLILQAKASAGVKQAEAALREVMSVQDCGFEFRVADEELPIMAQNVTLTKQQVVEMALARRPELALAAAAADAFRLEVYAQGALRFRRTVPTLGSASDIHSRLLPPGSRDPDKDYRPEPIPPEMPPQVVGSKQDRVDRVLAYSHRADAVFEKARNLIILEAEKSFYDYERASKQLSASKDANDEAMKALDLISKQFSEPKAPKDLLLLGFAQSSKAIAGNFEATFNYLQMLAALERVTAGGVRPVFKGR